MVELTAVVLTDKISLKDLQVTLHLKKMQQNHILLFPLSRLIPGILGKAHCLLNKSDKDT